MSTYYFSHNWKFRAADCEPLPRAVEALRDAEGRAFYDTEYDDSTWETVTLPHTYNDVDLFRSRIQDAGSGQKRTVAFYRNTLVIPKEYREGKIILVSEGIRQAAYVYLNGILAGYYEMGVGPFGIDLTPFADKSGTNCIAIAVDSTSSRNRSFCIAETPCGADPGTYLSRQQVLPGAVEAQETGYVPENCHEGVGFSWNCNDFNPTIGGISHALKLCCKPSVYLTLPLYANLKTRGIYVYADDFDLCAGTARIHVEAEVRNETDQIADCSVHVTIRSRDGKTAAAFSSNVETVPPAGLLPLCRTIVPETAYRFDPGQNRYVETGKEAYPETCSEKTKVIAAVSEPAALRFWDISDPCLYDVEVSLFVNGSKSDTEIIQTGFRQVAYDKDRGVLINGKEVWLRGYAQRSSNEWAAAGIVPEWLHDYDAELIRQSNANHIRYMHVAAFPEDVRADDRHGIVIVQPAGDKEKETFGRQWEQRLELMRNVIIAYRNHPSILFWEAGNNSISREHMRQMRLLKEELDPHGGRFMGCRTINEDDVVDESEYVGTMLNRHAARFIAEHGPICESEYSREEAPGRVWDDFTPPDFDYRNRYIGKGGKKQPGRDFYDLTSEELAIANARGYAEFYNDRIGGASGKNLYSACAALCWTDSAQHGRQAFSENARMSGRVGPTRLKKESFDVFRVMQSRGPAVKILGHWNYPQDTGDNYLYPVKRFNGNYFEETGEYKRRDPHHKTVYVIASDPIRRVELLVNGRIAGICEKPVYTFVFPIENVDITQRGVVEAKGFDRNGHLAASDLIRTAGKEAKLVLTAHTAPGGLLADGGDLAFFDVAVTDEEGKICPLSDRRIDFSLSGPAVFLGGYNSGRFDGFEDEYAKPRESVIHQSYCYAECGVNRVFIRAGRKAGTISLTAKAEGLESVTVTIHSRPADSETLTQESPAVWYPNEGDPAITGLQDMPDDPVQDRIKYEPLKEDYCKILVNGQEPDSRGIPSVNKNGSVWGNVMVILDRMEIEKPGCLTYSFDRKREEICLKSGSRTVIAKTHSTHLLINGEESLMDGEPYLSENGYFVMEIGALASCVEGASVLYDDRIHALRITLK